MVTNLDGGQNKVFDSAEKPGGYFLVSGEAGGAANLMKTIFEVAVLSVLLAVAPEQCLASEANADYTPSDVLSRLTASRKTVSNATFECVWKIFEDGPKSADGKTRGSSRWERQTFYWDDLGRRRIIAHGGPLSQDGKMLEDEDPTSTDDFFNGEIVVNAASHPKWDRNGGKPAPPKNAGGYNNAIISDAASQLRSALQTVRNPLEYMSNVAVNEIAVAIKSGSVAAHPAEDGRVAVDIKHTEPDSPYAKSVITVMPKHNWAIESVRSYRSDGKLAREIVSDYKEQADGLWVPIRLHHTHWGDRNQDDTPYFDWRFETTKAIFNDPSFDQHVFDVRLKRDTWVSDTRYKISYHVDEEEAGASDLVRYAADDPARALSLLGHALPAMQALKIDALPVALSNRMVLLCFFDLLQRPSRYCVTELAGRAAELDAKGVSMLAVQTSPVDPNALADFAKSNNLVCPLGRIESGEQKTRFNWGIKSQPWLILTDRSHIIRAEGFPIGELNEKLSAIR